MKISKNTPYNKIGKPGDPGFGKNMAKPDNVPTWLTTMEYTGTDGHNDYGTYKTSDDIRWTFRPDHWVRKGHVDSPNYSVYKEATIEIRPFSEYEDEKAAALDGYILEKASFHEEFEFNALKLELDHE